MERDYYKILLVAQSGKGKTYSARNLDPATTGFINVENKPLPFKNNFKHIGKPKNVSGVYANIKTFAESNEIKIIFMDSLSAILDMILAEARATKKGFDVWNFYNEQVAGLLRLIKSVNKEMIITAHYEWVQDEGGAKERRTKTKGEALPL